MGKAESKKWVSGQAVVKASSAPQQKPRAARCDWLSDDAELAPPKRIPSRCGNCGPLHCTPKQRVKRTLRTDRSCYAALLWPPSTTVNRARRSAGDAGCSLCPPTSSTSDSDGSTRTESGAVASPYPVPWLWRSLPSSQAQSHPSRSTASRTNIAARNRARRCPAKETRHQGACYTPSNPSRRSREMRGRA